MEVQTLQMLLFLIPTIRDTSLGPKKHRKILEVQNEGAVPA